MRVGIRVICGVCGYTKAPHGRSAPPDMYYCRNTCPGYWDEPKPGCLWPGETEADYGQPICSHATSDA